MPPGKSPAIVCSPRHSRTFPAHYQCRLVHVVTVDFEQNTKNCYKKRLKKHRVSRAFLVDVPVHSASQSARNGSAIRINNPASGSVPTLPTSMAFTRVFDHVRQYQLAEARDAYRRGFISSSWLSRPRQLHVLGCRPIFSMSKSHASSSTSCIARRISSQMLGIFAERSSRYFRKSDKGKMPAAKQKRSIWVRSPCDCVRRLGDEETRAGASNVSRRLRSFCPTWPSGIFDEALMGPSNKCYRAGFYPWGNPSTAFNIILRRPSWSKNRLV